MHRWALLVALSLVATAGAGGVGADTPAVAPAQVEAGSCAFPLTETDATGTAVTVPADPDRVVALQPSAAQTMWEIGASAEVVGMPVNRYTSGLEGYRRPTDVVGADGYTVVVEAVVDLTPDIVLAPNVSRPDTVATLRKAGLTVYHFRAAGSIDDVYRKTALTGRLTGNCDGARTRVDWMRGRIGRVRSAVAGRPRPTVLYPLGGGVVAGEGTFLHELVVTAGGRNLAAEAGVVGYRQLSAEEVVARDPEWLLINEDLPRSALRMDVYDRTTAVREGQVIRLDPDQANQPAPRIVYPIEAIARGLHPDAMATLDATTAAGTAGSTADRETTTLTTAPTTRAPALTGLGLLAGLVGLGVALLAGMGRPHR